MSKCFWKWANTRLVTFLSFILCYNLGHGSELPYVFHNAELGGFKYTSDELAMADAMVTYWTTFAHTGNPNPFVPHPPVPDWPPYRQNYTSTVFAAMKFKTPKSEVSMAGK